MERTTMESEPPVIEFNQVNGYTEVKPGLPPWLLRELRVSGRRFTLGGTRGFQTVKEDVPMCDNGPTGTPQILTLNDNWPTGTPRILTGLLPRVFARLQQEGYHLDIRGM